jgi:hypothetical protein
MIARIHYPVALKTNEGNGFNMTRKILLKLFRFNVFPYSPICAVKCCGCPQVAMHTCMLFIADHLDRSAPQWSI